jgi:hypothetical protein
LDLGAAGGAVVAMVAAATPAPPVLVCAECLCELAAVLTRYPCNLRCVLTPDHSHECTSRHDWRTSFVAVSQVTLSRPFSMACFGWVLDTPFACVRM